jgi:hypothetical protein
VLGAEVVRIRLPWSKSSTQTSLAAPVGAMPYRSGDRIIRALRTRAASSVNRAESHMTVTLSESSKNRNRPVVCCLNFC